MRKMHMMLQGQVDTGLFLFIVEALFKSRAHNEILEIEAINFYPNFMMHEFEPTQFHAVNVMRSKVCYCN